MGLLDYSIIFYKFWHVFGDDLAAIKKAIRDKIEDLRFDLFIDKIIVCADYGISFRKDIYMPYKGQRKAKDPLAIMYYWDVLESLRYPIRKVSTLEADDLCYYYAKNFEDSVVISEDRDLCQVLNIPNTKFYHPFARRFYMGDHKLEIMQKLLLGDAIDNIPRCIGPGIGPVKLKRLYMEHDKLTPWSLPVEINMAKFELNEKLVLFEMVDYDKYRIPWI